jgi:hypothetical protein
LYKGNIPSQDSLFIGRIIEIGHQLAFLVEAEIAIRSEERYEGGRT